MSEDLGLGSKEQPYCNDCTVSQSAFLCLPFVMHMKSVKIFHWCWCSCHHFCRLYFNFFEIELFKLVLAEWFVFPPELASSRAPASCLLIGTRQRFQVSGLKWLWANSSPTAHPSSIIYWAGEFAKWVNLSEPDFLLSKMGVIIVSSSWDRHIILTMIIHIRA